MKDGKQIDKKRKGDKMSDQNGFHLIGRIVRNAELKIIGQNQTPLATFSIAVNRWNKTAQTDDVSFFEMSYFGKSANSMLPYLTKGKQVSVKGFLKQDRWENEGQKFSRVSFIVTELQLLGGVKQENQQHQQETEAQHHYTQNNVQDYPQTGENSYQEAEGYFPEEIPF